MGSRCDERTRKREYDIRDEATPASSAAKAAEAGRTAAAWKREGGKRKRGVASAFFWRSIAALAALAATNFSTWWIDKERGEIHVVRLARVKDRGAGITRHAPRALPS